ncbi:hypothetical protein [Edaphobacter dinghuensis]|uniref:Uncharacterized protein n=1 Tax=Edaphobacter dinghuensis TaxID=1560005 RepID=A0A917M8Y0_9BACT|nr:hypothetical protein [Edaphobacter dinghuensis]GGG84932.1 hypothetical protein GCM10011585_30930 [Edaphobacter dinghuensis]
MKLLRAAVVGVVLLVAVSGTYSSGQLAQPFPSQQPTQGRPGVDVPPLGPSISPEMQAQQARSRNSDRQKQLVDDTNKLLVLATQLKQDVDKTNKDVLSVDVIKKADEIEKLAHSVKERMKGL